MITPDYEKITPEEEAKLVPKNVEVRHDGTCWNLPGSKMNALYGRQRIDDGDGIICEPLLQLVGLTSTSNAKMVAPALAFFAATGRLPRRLDSGGAV